MDGNEKEGKMMGYITSGNQAVDMMGMMNISGNVIPQVWYSKITRDNGKPYLLAITILADIVYWYRPVEVRDQQSGRVTGWKKRFYGDLLQKTYQQYADLYGESKRSVKSAFDRLERLGVIRRELRDVPCENGIVLYNLMYIELYPEVLRQLTYPEEAPEIVKEHHSEPAIEWDSKTTQEVVQNFVGGGTKASDTLLQKNGPSSALKRNSSSQKNVPGDTAICETNTESTTENINEKCIYPIDQRCDNLPEEIKGMDRVVAYKQVIKDNISYDILVHDRSEQTKQINEIVELLTETVAVMKEKVRINGADYPYQLVKSKFLELNYFHVCYALDCLNNNTSVVKNIRAYLLTTLYNASNTLDNHYQCKVNHDLYGNHR